MNSLQTREKTAQTSFVIRKSIATSSASIHKNGNGRRREWGGSTPPFPQGEAYRG